MSQVMDYVCVCVCVIFACLLGARAADCPMGYYGEKCLQQCSANCASMVCDQQTGACEGHCEDGWTGASCDQACPKGTFGYNCSKSCPDHCLQSECHASNGTCALGCNPGYTGSKCRHVCRRGFFGTECKKRCSNNCAQEECHPESGYCLKGCKADFWGSDCSLFGNFKDAPIDTQDKFYDKLSAESRGVLLFVLMGQYESTLERAQEEIRRGIRQRNEIRRLIG